MLTEARAKGSLDKIRQTNDPRAAGLVEAISCVLGKELTDGKQWSEKIEALREKLAHSDRILEIIDYGARAPGVRLTEEEMRQGKVIHPTVGQVCKTAAVKPNWARFLFTLVRQLKPQRCLELGTSLGISGAYQGAALTLNGSGSLLTLEGAPSLAAVAQENWASLGLGTVTVMPGRFADTLDEAIARTRPIDYAFIDGHHDERATIHYFEQIRPHCSPDAFLVFDDTLWSEGMRRAWKAIADHASVAVAVDLGRMGVCLLGREKKLSITIADTADYVVRSVISKVRELIPGS